MPSKLKLGWVLTGAACGTLCHVQADASGHPNKMPFTGTLLVLGSPSDKPPHGSEGHRILVTKDVAAKRLKTLIGMGVNYAPDLDGHAPRRKVGVITHAWISGKELKVRGVVWKKDFPEAEDDLKQRRLGMSMELADVWVSDKNDDIWKLTDFHFTGATILQRDAAAYYNTALAAAASALGVSTENAMPKEKTAAAGSSQGALLTHAIAASVGPAIQASLGEGLKPLVDAINKQNESLSGIVRSVGELRDLQIAASINAGTDEDEDELDLAAAKAEDDEDDDEDDDMDGKASKKKDDEDDDEDDDDEDDDDEDDDVEASLADLAKSESNSTADGDEDAKPGASNKTVKNEGNKTTVSASKAKHRAGSMSAAALVRSIQAAQAENRRLGKLVKRIAAEGDKRLAKAKTQMNNKVAALEAQVSNFADRESRRTIPAEITNLLAKSNVDATELAASGRKLSVPEVDSMISTLEAAAGVQFKPEQKMNMKNQLLSHSMMDEGFISRTQ